MAKCVRAKKESYINIEQLGSMEAQVDGMTYNNRIKVRLKKNSQNSDIVVKKNVTCDGLLYYNTLPWYYNMVMTW